MDTPAFWTTYDGLREQLAGMQRRLQLAGFTDEDSDSDLEERIAADEALEEIDAESQRSEDCVHQRYMFCNRLRENISEIQHRLHWALQFTKTDDLTKYDWEWNHRLPNGVRLFEIVLHEFDVSGLLESLPSLRAVSRKLALVASSLQSAVYSCGVAQASKHASQLVRKLHRAAWEDPPYDDFGSYLPNETGIRRLSMSCEIYRLLSCVPGWEDMLNYVPSWITAIQRMRAAVQGTRDSNFKVHPDVFAARVELAQLLLLDGKAEESAEVAQAALSDAEVCGTTGQLPGTEVQRAQLSKEFEVLRAFLREPIKRYREREWFEEGPAAVSIETHVGNEEGIKDVLGEVDDRQREDPAIILPEEASWIQDEIFASFIEQRALVPRSSSSADRHPVFDCVSRVAVLLTFSRASKALDMALFESSASEVARSQGVDVTPPWAKGAKVFVCGVGPEHLEPAFPDLMPRHVILYEDDVDDLLDEMKERLPYSLRKVKPHERMSMPADMLSLMEVSCGGGSAEDGGAASSTGLESCAAKTNDDIRFQVVVLNTFFDLDVYESEQQSVRSVGSAPF